MVMEAICEITGNIFQLSPGHFKNHSPQWFRHCLMAGGPTGERRSICRCKSQSMGHGATPRMGSKLILFTNEEWGSTWSRGKKTSRTIVDLSWFILIYLYLSLFIFIYLYLSLFQIFYVRMVVFPSLGEHQSLKTIAMLHVQHCPAADIGSKL